MSFEDAKNRAQQWKKAIEALQNRWFWSFCCFDYTFFADRTGFQKQLDAPKKNFLSNTTQFYSFTLSSRNFHLSLDEAHYCLHKSHLYVYRLVKTQKFYWKNLMSWFYQLFCYLLFHQVSFIHCLSRLFVESKNHHKYILNLMQQQHIPCNLTSGGVWVSVMYSNSVESWLYYILFFFKLQTYLKFSWIQIHPDISRLSFEYIAQHSYMIHHSMSRCIL